MITTVLSSSIPAIQALFVETPSPCVVKPQGIHNPPACPDGVPGGALLPVFRATSCESVWPEYLATAMDYWAPRRHAVYAILRQPSTTYGWLPASDFAVALSDLDPDGWGSAVFVTGDRITGIAFGCGQPVQGVAAAIASAGYVLPPP